MGKGRDMITNLSVTDMYMSVLSSLSIDDKLDLITKLTNSIRNKKEVKISDEDWFASFSGNWNDISSESLRESRTFTRTVDTW